MKHLTVEATESLNCSCGKVMGIPGIQKLKREGVLAFCMRIAILIQVSTGARGC